MAQKKRFQFPLAWVGRVVGMSVITVFAVLVMIAVNLKGRTVTQSTEGDGSDSEPASVTVLELTPERIEITEKYSGMIRPLERFEPSFKSTGRVRALGNNDKGTALDVGDFVQADQVIAELDTDVFLAQKTEIEAMIEFAEGEFNRATELRRQQGAISDSEFGRKKRELAVAKAQLKTLQTQIDDAILKSPIDGIISKRFVKPGESVGLGQNVFELIQVNQVKLVVGVPESKIFRMIGEDIDTQSLKAYVTLIGQQRTLGDSKPIVGKVRRVSETSDEKSGLFELEILLENRDRKLRPGMIAIAKIVVETIDGFRIPSDAVFEREKETFIFVACVATDEADPQKKTATDVKDIDPSDSTKREIAKKLVLKRGTFEYQEGYLIARDIPEANRNLIITGHHRLVDQRPIVYSGNKSD